MTKNIKVVILCGGRGMRLREETEHKPKPLVLIGGKPMLWHIMKTYSHYGYNDFVLCLGYKGEMIKEYFLKLREMVNDFTLDFSLRKPKALIHSNNAPEKWKITFVDTGLDTFTGGRIARVEKYITDQDFFLTYGDGVADINIKDLYRFHKQQGRIATVTGVYPRTFYGLLSVSGDSVGKYAEKPVLKRLVNGGFFVCNKKIFDYLSKDESCVFEKEPLTKLSQGGQLSVYRHRGDWFTVNTHKDWEEINRIWIENPVWRVWK